jgi:tellurite resistance protein
MDNKTTGENADWMLKAMVVVAASDGALDERESVLIRQIYEDRSGRALSADEVSQAAKTFDNSDAIAAFTAASKTLDQATKEEVIRCAYRVLLADNRIAGEERKKLKNIADALRISEVHFGAILEDSAA